MTEVLAACGGVFRGVGLAPVQNGDGAWNVQVVVDHTACAGGELSLFGVDDDGTIRSLQRVG
ncbi:MAG: hypothetical protein GEU96_16555 [Propionibacteriales bacterium]|nr:hypothetical protein [Propionibacteriales bacterium]